MPDDQELLRAFAEEKSEAAFATLVQHYLPMIYATACRQTGDAHRAEEVALQAFTLLARKAGSLKNHPALGGWLYTTTGHLAAHLRRTEARRARREQEAHAMQESDTPADQLAGEDLRSVVDEIMLALPERDRTAVILRYFENNSHARIGERLGVSENAARMRVERALDQLRRALQRRGIVSTAAALSTALAAGATAVPPAGLAAEIGACAPAAAAGSGLLFLMNTTLLKTGLVIAAMGLTGGLIWQRQENDRLHAEIASLQAQLKPRQSLPVPSNSVSATDGARAPDFSRLSAQLGALPDNPAASWQERANVLEELMGQLPEMQIPELAFAKPEDWLDATKQPLKTDADYRRALAQVRTAVVRRFVQQLQPGLQAYLAQNNGVFPTEPAQLAKYLANPISPEVWKHYKIVPADSILGLGMGGDHILTLKSPVDPDYDAQFAVGRDGFGFNDYRSLVIRPVIAAYIAANPRNQPASPADLLPYAKTNAQRSAIRAAIDDH